MCFHTSNTKTAKQNEKRFDASFNIPEVFEPYYHRAGYENNYIYIIRQNNHDLIEPAYWGLLPEYQNISKRMEFLSKYPTWNTRTESIYSGLSSKHILDNRCLILVDGFYEPHKINNKSFPHYCRYKDKSLFAFAGIYSELDDGLYTASVITTIANPFFAQVHNVKKKGTYRMPLVLDELDEVNWINEDLNRGDIDELLFSFTKKEFEAYPVSKDIDFKRNPNRPDIIDKVNYPEFNTLF